MLALSNINQNLSNLSYASAADKTANKLKKEQTASNSVEAIDLSTQIKSSTSLSLYYNNIGEAVHTIGDMAHTAVNISETVLDTSKTAANTISNTYDSLYNTAKDTADTINNTLKLSADSYNNLKANLTIMKDSAVDIASTITSTAGKIASNLSKIAAAAVTSYSTLKAINNKPGSIFIKGTQSAYAIYNGASSIWNSMKEIHTSVHEGYESVSKDYSSFAHAASDSVTSALELKNTLQAGADIIYQNGLNMANTTKSGAVELYNAISNGYVTISNQLSNNKVITLKENAIPEFS